MESNKASGRNPLDELLGMDPRGFDEEELTQVLSGSSGTPDPAVSATVESLDELILTEEVVERPEHLPEILLDDTGGDRITVPGEGAAPPPGVESGVPIGHESPSPARMTGTVFPDSGAVGNSPADPLVGTLVDGRYRVLNVLGLGGIGLVYLCQHELLEKPVAMKVLRSEYVSHRDLNERFLLEARAASAIKSPHIVDTIDVGTLPTGAPYFVMEYVAGETLASLLEREGAVSLSETLEIGRQIAEGLSAAHAAGVVHRDLKPENVFLARQTDEPLFVKIFDFGIAKVAGTRKRLTHVGAVFGTPTYMSPEQARGEAVDARSDIYALGVMIFEMLAGAVPFDGEDPLAIMAQHVDKPPPALSGMSRVPVPSKLERIVHRCLEKDPNDRYPTAALLLDDLNEVTPDSPVVAPIPTPPRAQRPETLHAHVVTAPPAPRRNRPVLVALSLAFLTAAGGWAFSSGLFERSSPEETSVANKTPSRRAVVPVPASSSRESSDEEESREVHFVLFPLDARVFRGDEDLGQMPVSIHVKPDEPIVVTVRRKGFSTRKVVVDGTEQRLVVGLIKTPEPTLTEDDGARRPVLGRTESGTASTLKAKRTPARTTSQTKKRSGDGATNP